MSQSETNTDKNMPQWYPPASECVEILPDFEALARALEAKVKTDENGSGEIISAVLPSPWVSIPAKNHNPFMVRAIHPEKKLKADIYSPYTCRFTEQVYRALSQLAELPLSFSILPPEGRGSKTLFFPQGEVTQEPAFTIMTPDDQELIATILETYGLRRKENDMVTCMTIGDKQFVTDIIDTSPFAIMNFLSDN